MDEIKKDEVFSTLNRLTDVIQNSHLIQDLSSYLEIKTAVVGGAARDLYLDKPIKDIDIAISVDFTHNLKVEYPVRNERKIYSSSDFDDESEYWDRATAEADALRSRNFNILQKLKSPEYSIIHEFLEQNPKELDAINAIVFLIRKIIESNDDYSIAQIFDKTTEVALVKKAKIDDIPYENMGLCAVIGIKDKYTDYPIELLFTTDKPFIFTKCFDFDICKIHMENIDGEAVINPSNEFLQEIESKTITYTPPQQIDENKINKSLLVRYERLQKKFPDYTLTARTLGIVDDMKLLIERTVAAINLKYELNSNDTIASPQKVKKTNKI